MISGKCAKLQHQQVLEVHIYTCIAQCNVLQVSDSIQNLYVYTLPASCNNVIPGVTELSTSQFQQDIICVGYFVCINHLKHIKSLTCTDNEIWYFMILEYTKQNTEESEKNAGSTLIHSAIILCNTLIVCTTIKQSLPRPCGRNIHVHAAL